MRFQDQVEIVVAAIKTLDSLGAPTELADLDRARGKIDDELNRVFDGLAADIYSDQEEDDDNPF